MEKTNLEETNAPTHNLNYLVQRCEKTSNFYGSNIFFKKALSNAP
jgi:hypothetical protein